MRFFKKIFGGLSVFIISTALFFAVFADSNAQWKKNDKGWWYEEADGSYPVKAWKYIGDKWYYFDDIGYMAENRWIGNYYLGADGAMLVNTKTPDGYYVDINGKWIENYKPVNPNPVSRSSSGSSGGSGGSSRSSGNSSSSGSNSGGSSSGESVINTDDNNSAVQIQIINELMAYGLTQQEAELYYLINEYRAGLGLEKLSFSKSLTEVAREHVADSNANQPENQLDARGIQGNLHSWSSKGNWTPVVYTSDHAYAELMWMKPKELTSYTGNGYEISVTSSRGISPKAALDAWKGSSGHNAVIIGSGSWSMLKTMGVSIDGNYAHVWFGSEADPVGYYDVAGYEVIYP